MGCSTWNTTTDGALLHNDWTALSSAGMSRARASWLKHSVKIGPNKPRMCSDRVA